MAAITRCALRALDCGLSAVGTRNHSNDPLITASPILLVAAVGSLYTFPVQRRIIPLIFALSGAAGLVFEVVWARQLVLVFGNTTQAVSAILTGFFGGMAIGSWYGGRIADSVERPLRLYGVIEITLAGVVLVTPVTFALIRSAYQLGYGTIGETPSLLPLLRYVLALIALGPATILMGATLPTLTRHLARTDSSLGKEFTALYVANTMGAVFGAAIAGLVLIELLGLSGALLVGASCSATAGIIALAMDRAAAGGSASDISVPRSTNDDAPHDSGSVTLALTFAFVSGFTSLSYQTLWTRLIASGTGSSTYVFTTILTVFLIGLAMGAVEYKRVRGRLRDVAGAIALSQILTGLLAVTGMIAITRLDSLPGAFIWKSLVVVLPATFVMGYGFPASSALIGGTVHSTGRRAGRLLATNTVGAIAGTFIVPFFLIPAFGSPRMIAITASVNVITGIIIAFRGIQVSPRLRTFTIVGALLFAATMTFSIAFRGIFIDPQVARMRALNSPVYESLEDEIASVQSGKQDGRKQLWVTGFSMTTLTVDAKLMPILPLMLRPASRTVLTIAFGMGSSFRSAIIAGLSPEAVELVPSVPEMFEQFYSDAREIKSNPRGRILIGDGRNFVELTDRKYDIIVVDPPPPLQSSGVSIISSREFYEASRRRLTPAGVMMQWVPWGQSLDDFKHHVRTFRSVFTNVMVARGPAGNGFYLLGSDTPLQLTRDNVRSVLERPGVIADISSAYDSPAHDMETWLAAIPELIRLHPDETLTFAGTGPLITDDRPLPEYFLIRLARGDETWLNPDDIRPTK
jgi:spermidine synthase